ncbi:MAG: hypothetical protein RL585_2808, partial [Pseudomonadota bacterium]
ILSIDKEGALTIKSVKGIRSRVIMKFLSVLRR